MLSSAPPGARAARAELDRVATASEELLEVFDKRSVHYAQSMQMLAG